MKYEKIGLIVGVALCLLDTKGNRKEKKKTIVNELCLFIHDIYYQEKYRQNDWLWNTQEKEDQVCWTLSKGENPYYIATYCKKDNIIRYEKFYQEFIASEYWMIIDALLQKKIMTILENKQIEKERRENVKKEEPTIKELEKNLRILKKRGK